MFNNLDINNMTVDKKHDVFTIYQQYHDESDCGAAFPWNDNALEWQWGPMAEFQTLFLHLSFYPLHYWFFVDSSAVDENFDLELRAATNHI